MFETEIFIWSRLGHTPLTKRAGAYYDELLKTVILCENPADALEKGRELLRNTEHGFSGAFFIPEYPNLNTRQKFFHL